MIRVRRRKNFEDTTLYLTLDNLFVTDRQTVALALILSFLNIFVINLLISNLVIGVARSGEVDSKGGAIPKH